MAYDKNKLFKQAEQAIKNNNLFFIEDIVAFIPCNKDTFYRYFPVISDEYVNLRNLLEENKVKTKSSIRAKLYKSSKAAELLSLYRLICTKEERQKLNQQYIENKNINIDANEITDVSQRDKIKKYLIKKLKDSEH